MSEETVRPLDATDVTQIMGALQSWINGLTDPETKKNILPDHLWLEYPDDRNGLGFFMKSDGGEVVEEYINGDFSAEIAFLVYYTSNIVPDGAGEVYKPLNDLSAWFRKNGVTGLNIGERRTPDKIITTRGPTDLSGPDEKDNTTFFSIFLLSYDEEVA